LKTFLAISQQLLENGANMFRLKGTIFHQQLFEVTSGDLWEAKEAPLVTKLIRYNK
jgi:hypothetical protein